MTEGDVQDRYCSEKELGRDGPFVSQLVRLRTAGQTSRMLLRRLAPEVTFEQSAVRAFIEMSENLCAVDAPHILKTIECGVDRAGLYIVTEYPRHVTLMSLLGRLTFPPPQAAMVVAQAACGLTAAGVELAHGTLTPRHLWIMSTGIIKIKDIGLHLLFRDLGQWFKEETTSYWLDPGVLAGLKPDQRADCYSLGRILLVLLRGGTIPKNNEGASAVAYHEDLPEHVPGSLRSILAACLHPDRSRRFGQSKDLLSTLNTFLKEEGVTDPVDGLNSFLRQRAKGTGSLERSDQPTTSIRQPDHHPPLLDASAFWGTEHEEYPVEEDDTATQELSNTLAQGLLNLSQGGNTRPCQPERHMPVVDSNKSSEAVSVPIKHLGLSIVPLWLKVVGGILLATTIGGLLGWYLIGQWTLEESGGRNLNIPKTTSTDAIEEHGPKDDAAVFNGGGKPSVEPPATKILSNNNNVLSQEPVSGKGTKANDTCIAGCGWIYITSVPSGATVELDGKEVPGKTPLLINEVSANDSHVLQIILSGKKPHKQNVNVNSGDVLNLNIELK